MSKPSDFYLTTCLIFEDGGREGQFLHAGDLESCEDVQRMLPAIAYSGDRRVTDARMVIVESADFCGDPPDVGQCWALAAPAREGEAG